MKRLISIALCIMLLGMTAISASAATLDNANKDGAMTISAEVPSTHKITVANTDGGAEVIYNQAVGSVFTVERLSKPKLTVRAKSGYAIKSVKLGETDITAQLISGSITLEAIYEDKTLTVVTEATESNPNEQTYTVKGKVTQNGNPVGDVTLELRGSSLKTAVTGNDGTFQFDKVETGHHSLTAIMDGKIVATPNLS